jgi:hypothetical protein
MKTVSKMLFGSVVLACCNSTDLFGNPTSDDVLDVPPDGIVNVQVNEAPTKFQFVVRGDEISYPVLNSDIAESLKLRSNIFANLFGIEARVGPVSIPGHTAKVSFTINGKNENRRALWFDQPISSNSSGSLSPETVPQSKVILHIGEKKDHAQVSSVPLQSDDHNIGTSIKVGEKDVFVRFNPLRQHSIASAGTAQVMVSVYKGQWSGEEGSEMIDFGIARPVRELSLSVPLKVGGVSISKMLVRDFRQVTGVAEKNIQNDADPNEVVLPEVSVTAQNSKTKPVYNLTLGRDVLGQCDSVSFDKTSKQIQLSCAPLQ